MRASEEDSPTSDRHNPPNSIENEPLHYDFDDSRCDYEGESLRLDQVEEDEDGFPSFQLLQSDRNTEPIGGIEDGADESFASSFYRSGTDWSRLLSEEEEDKERGALVGKANDSGARVDLASDKKLKQANLLQMWGLKRKEAGRGGEELRCSISFQAKKRLRTPSVSLSEEKNSGAAETRRRACPFYKKIPGTSFTVDAFRYGCVTGCSAYFLTHFHADHYGGLSRRWSHGPIYCTPLTARLVGMCLHVNPLFICPLELNKEHIIEGVRVTLLDANHCPGAALIHFRLSSGQCFLHTGDFRASKTMQAYQLLVNQRVDVLYLDTTYCNPKYKFPCKEDVLNYVVRVTVNFLKKRPRTLIVVGAYSIGKECVYLALSNALGVKVHVNASRRRILESFDWPELSERISSNAKDTHLHVLPISALRFETLDSYLKSYRGQFTAVLAFRPTGWTYSQTIGNQLDQIKPSSKGKVTIYGVPYSEHSSFPELQEFVQFLRPRKIIPTVNIWNAASRDKIQSYFREWLRD